MTTQLNFVLSDQLKHTLTSNGAGNNNVYAYAISFDSNGDIVGQPLTLVNNGQFVPPSSANTQVSGAPYLNLPAQFKSGVTYVLIQQNGNGNLPDHIKAGVHPNTNPGDNPLGVITPADAAHHNYTYMLVETTLGNSSFDLGDVSAQNTFGFATTFEAVFDPTHSVTTGYQGDSRGFKSSTDTIFGALTQYAPDATTQWSGTNIFGTTPRLGIGPSSKEPNFPGSDWQAYIDALVSHPETLSDIKLVQTFGGSPYDTAKWGEYGLEYDPGHNGQPGLWLVPDNRHGATNTDWIWMSLKTLRDNIYTQSDNPEIHQGGRTGPIETFPIPKLVPDGNTTSGFTPNTADGAVTRALITGFDAGFFGSTGTSPNPKDTTTVNLNHSTNWNIYYAYNGTVAPDPVTVTNVLGSGPGAAGQSNRFYDPWAQAIEANGNAYGYPFADFASVGGINPQLTMWDPKLNAQIQELNLYLYDPTETPPTATATSPGFKPAPHAYVPGPLAGGDYSPALTGHSSPPAPFGYSNQLNFTFGFQGLAPKNDVPVSLNIYKGNGTFTNVTLQQGSDGTVWQNYYIQDNHDGTFSAPGTGGSTNTPGNFILYNLPTTADNTVGWYQLLFGSVSHQTVYNIYATPETYSFNGGTSVPGAFKSVVIDHGVQQTSAAGTFNSVPTVSFTFTDTNGNPLWDIDNLPTVSGYTITGTSGNDTVDANTTVAGQSLPTPWHDTILGLLGNDSLSALGGDDTLNGGGGIDRLEGDSGADTFVFDSVSLTDAASGIIDRITDYDQGNAILYNFTEKDVLDLQTITGSAYNSGSSPGLLVRAISDPLTGRAHLQVDPTGAADGAQWTNLADLSGINSTYWLKVALASGASDLIGVREGLGRMEDFTGDGKADILWRDDDGTVALWTMNPDTKGAHPQENYTLSKPPTQWHITATDDFSGDGKADILWVHDSGKVSMWTISGGQETNTDIGNPGRGWHLVGVGDFGGDHKADILWRSDSGAVVLWQMNGATITNNNSLGAIDNDWRVQGTADFNGDGKQDILWRHEGGAAEIWLMDGAIPTTKTTLAGADQHWRIADTADFNGDGKSDILWRHDDGEVAIWMMNGTSIAQNTTLSTNPGTNWQILSTADFNGNGSADILWRDKTSGSVAIWVMDGATIAQNTTVSTNPGLGWQVAEIGDLSGDGKADIQWRSDTGTVATWMMNGPTIEANYTGSTIGLDWATITHHFELM